MIIRNIKWFAASLLLLLGLRYFQSSTLPPVGKPVEQPIPVLADGFPYRIPEVGLRWDWP